MPKEIRIKLSLRNPNPLFEKWLENWMYSSEKQNLMKQHSLRKALDSLRKYPLVLHSGRDCSILEGFGRTICENIDKQLTAYKLKQHVLTETEHQDSINEVIDKVQEILKNEETVKRKTNKSETQIRSIVQKYGDCDSQLDSQLVKNLSDHQSTQNDILIPAYSFEIVLFVDTAETIG